MEAQAALRHDMFYLGFDWPVGATAPRQVIYDARDHTVYVRLYEKPLRASIEIAEKVESDVWAFGPHAEAICRLLNRMPAGNMTVAAAMDELELMVSNLAQQFADIAGMLQGSIANANVPSSVSEELDSLRNDMLALAGKECTK